MLIAYTRRLKFPKNLENQEKSMPATFLKTLQTSLLRLLECEDVAYISTGFRKGKSGRDNALPHVNSMINVDIKEFSIQHLLLKYAN